MTDMLPIVEELYDYRTHSERGLWLKRCSDGVIHREHMAIRRILQSAGLLAGIAYLEARLAAVNAVRLPDGSLPQTVVMSVNMALIDLTIATRQEGN